MGEKASCLLNRKVRKKNQIPEYHAPSPKGYNKKDTRRIDQWKTSLPSGSIEDKNQKIYKV